MDDEEDVRTTMRDVLTMMLPGLEVRICASASEALALLQALPRFGAVLTDYRMPGMDGLALLDALHAMDPRVPVVLATAFSEHETRELALSKGAFAFLPKPFSAADLVEVVCAALRAGVQTQVRPRHTGHRLATAPSILRQQPQSDFPG